MKLTIYGQPNCGYCDRAIELARQYQLEFEYFSISNTQYKADLKEKYEADEKASVKPLKTVPQIWNGDSYIGGYTELASEIENTLGGYGEQKV